MILWVGMFGLVCIVYSVVVVLGSSDSGWVVFEVLCDYFEV